MIFQISVKFRWPYGRRLSSYLTIFNKVNLEEIHSLKIPSRNVLNMTRNSEFVGFFLHKTRICQISRTCWEFDFFNIINMIK